MKDWLLSILLKISILVLLLCVGMIVKNLFEDIKYNKEFKAEAERISTEGFSPVTRSAKDVPLDSIRLKQEEDRINKLLGK